MPPTQTTAYVARPLDPAAPTNASNPITMERITYPTLDARQLLVSIAAASLCASDLKAAHGAFHMAPPLILGHEAAGYVRETGPGVTAFGAGDAVVLSFASCGACRACLGGRAPYCEELFGLNFSGSGGGGIRDERGEAVKGLFFGQSSMCRVALVHESCAVKVGVETREDLVLFAGLGCGIQTGAGAIWNVARPPVGSSILIFGAGAVGLAALLAAQLTAPASLVLVEHSQAKLDSIPKEILVDVQVFNFSGMRREETVGILRRFSVDGKGMDFALDCAGSPEVIATCAESLSKCGTVLTVGGVLPGQETSFMSEKFLVGGLTYRGTHQGDSVPRIMIPEMIRQWRQGRFPFDKLLNRFKFEELENALEAAKAGRIIKPLLVVQ